MIIQGTFSNGGKPLPVALLALLEELQRRKKAQG
jgi:hypothetical protein